MRGKTKYEGKREERPGPGNGMGIEISCP